MPMQIFDYVMLLVSVVLSLGLARLLETHARLVKRGTAVKWSAVYVAWLLILAAMHVDLWAIDPATATVAPPATTSDSAVSAAAHSTNSS